MSYKLLEVDEANVAAWVCNESVCYDALPVTADGIGMWPLVLVAMSEG